MNQQLKGLLWLTLTMLVGGLAALGLPYLAHVIPWSVETHASSWLGLPVLPPCRQHPEANALLDKIAKRLYPLYAKEDTFPVTIDVVPGVPVNAFATLGGHIYVYNGLIQQAQSPEELAGVLAHELEHVRRRHILQGVLVRLLTFQALQFLFGPDRQLGPEVGRMLLGMSFSREQEREADKGGLERLHDAHVDVMGLKRFFDRMQLESSVPAFVTDHPASSDRAELVQMYSGGPTEPLMTRPEWQTLQAICQ